MRRLKQYISVVLVGLVLTLLGRYLANHPEVVHQLKNVSPASIASLLGLYILTLIPLVIILLATVKLCGKKIQHREGFLLAIYTAIINFFGPLQSGPGFRALYLKKKHQLSLKKYGLASLTYYVLFAGVNMLFILLGGGLWQLALLGCAIATALLLGLRQFDRNHQIIVADGSASYLQLLIGTILLVSTMCIIYLVELRTITPDISVGQAMSYTGAANMSLFVAITPGAIGFRESFVLFTQQLHHVPSSTVVAASTLDRAVYIVFLGILFVVSLLLHAQNALSAKQLREAAAQVDAE